MFLSIIVPAYNASRYIVRNLDSIYQQNMEDIEVIIVNDGSTDNTASIIEEYREKHPDLNLEVVSIENGGLANARNIGLEKARGKYFINLDSDDFLKANILQAIKDKSKEIDFDVCTFGFEDYNEETNKYENPYDDNFLYIDDIIDGESACLKKMKREIWICQGSACYRKSIIEEYKIENIKGVNQGEDFSFISRCLLCSKKVVSIPFIGVSISYRQDSMMHCKYNKTYLEMFSAISTIERALETYTFLKNKDLLLKYLNCEYEVQRLAVSKKIVENYSIFNLYGAMKEINRNVPQRKKININLLNHKKKVESFLFNNCIIIYLLFTKIYKGLHHG